MFTCIAHKFKLRLNIKPPARTFTPRASSLHLVSLASCLVSWECHCGEGAISDSIACLGPGKGKSGKVGGKSAKVLKARRQHRVPQRLDVSCLF